MRGLDGSDGELLAAWRSASSLAFASRSRLVGGSGGSFAWSSDGGSLLPGWPSPDWFRERLEIVERYDTSEEFEFRLPESA